MPTLAGFQGSSLIPDVSGGIERGLATGKQRAVDAMTPELLERANAGDEAARLKLVGLNPAALQNLYTSDRLGMQNEAMAQANIKQQALDAVTSEREAALRNRAQTSMLLEGGVDSLSENIKKWVLAHSGDEDFDVQEAQEISNLSITDPIQAYNMIKAQDAQFQGEIDLADQILGQTAGSERFSVKSSEILPDGTSIQVMTDGSTRVTDPQGLELVGSDRASAIQAANDYGIDIQSRRASGRAEATQGVKLATEPDIRAAVIAAESEARNRGEVITELGKARAALPGLMDTMDSLRELAPNATYTIGGRAFNALVKELGFGSTEGSTARAKFISIIDNQVLPLLKPTFGGSFSVQEGESLKATLGNVNATPEEKIATLDAFIANKVREIEAKEREVDALQPVSDADVGSMTDDELFD